MYDPAMVQPLRDELTSLGVEELHSSDDVMNTLKNTKGTTLLIVNSVCGCAAAGARPAVGIALQHETRPDRVVTVFAGQDVEAVATARAFIGDTVPPSSPCFALFKGSDLAYFVPRHMIEGRDAQTIAWDMVQAFDEHCAPENRG